MTARKDPADFLPRGRPRSPATIRRNGRRSGTRPAIIGAYGSVKAELQAALLDALAGPCEPAHDAERPRTRADCVDGPRPCPWTSCPEHLGIDVTRHGGLRVTWPELQIGDLLFSCALDVADNYPAGLTTDQVGAILNLTNERVRQIEAAAMVKLKGLMRGY